MGPARQLIKIGRFDGSGQVPAFTRDAFERKRFHDGSECIVARSVSDPVGLLIRFLATFHGSVEILYVLLISRSGRNAVGRHQSPTIDVSQAITFLQQFGNFLMGDGRHELWIYSPSYFNIVYDHHERIWLYGDVAAIESWLIENGIPKEPLEAIPVPHSHHYHPEYDESEDEVMAIWNWTTTELQDGDGG